MRKLSRSRLKVGNSSVSSVGSLDLVKRRRKRDCVIRVLRMVGRNGSMSPEDILRCLRRFKERAREREDWPKRRRYVSSTSRWREELFWLQLSV
jgi:hypothetical protein